MRLIRVLTPVAVAPLLLFTGCGPVSSHAGPREVVIAADLEMTGTGAPIGTAYAQALRLRTEQLNDDGSLGGRRISLRVIDNRSDRGQTVTDIAALAGDPRVTAIITGACSDCLLAALPTVTQARVPTVSLAAATEVASPAQERRYVFKIGPDADDNAAVLTARLARTRVTSIGVLASENLYGVGVARSLARRARSAGIRVVSQGQFRTTDVDLTHAARAATAGRPQALVVLGAAGRAGLASKGARDAGFHGQVLFDAVAAGDLFLTGATAPSTEGAVMVSGRALAVDDVIASTPAEAARARWFRDYVSRYGGYTAYAAYAADAVDVLAAAITRAGGGRDAVRDALEDTHIDGLSGPIRLTPAQHSGLTGQTWTLVVARSGRWRLLP